MTEGGVGLGFQQPPVSLLKTPGRYAGIRRTGKGSPPLPSAPPPSRHIPCQCPGAASRPSQGTPKNIPRSSAPWSRRLLPGWFWRVPSRDPRPGAAREDPGRASLPGKLRFPEPPPFRCRSESFPHLNFGLNLRRVPGPHFAGAAGTELVCVSHWKFRPLPDLRGTRLESAPLPSNSAFSPFPLNPNLTILGGGKLPPFITPKPPEQQPLPCGKGRRCRRSPMGSKAKPGFKKKLDLM